MISNDVIRTQDLKPGMSVEGPDGLAHRIIKIEKNLSSGRLEIACERGTFYLNSHPLTLWRLR